MHAVLIASDKTVHEALPAWLKLIAEDPDYGVELSVYTSECRGYWPGKFAASSVVCERLDVTANPLRVAGDADATFLRAVGRLRQLIQEYTGSAFVPCYRSGRYTDA